MGRAQRQPSPNAVPLAAGVHVPLRAAEIPQASEALPDQHDQDKAGPSKQVAVSETVHEPIYQPPNEKIAPKHLQWMAKRLFDLSFGAASLVAGAPLLAVIAVAIKFDSQGPVFYRQTRVGKGGKTFKVFKFRSMYTDAEKNGPQWARNFDARVTRVGGLLRRTSLDELPQIFNILAGDMSWIGPRPERPVFVARFRQQFENYDLRHTVRPGLSGWAQVNGLRGNVSIAQRTVYDLHYVRNFSLAMDLKIFLRTFAAVVAGE